MNNKSESMITTERGFTICEIVQMEGGEPGIQIKTGKKYEAMPLAVFLEKYYKLYKQLYGGCVSEVS